MNNTSKFSLILAAALLPAVAFASETMTKPAQAPTPTTAVKQITSPATTGTVKAAQLDLNMATEAELAALPDVGEANAKAIISGRPYKAVDELESRKILTAKTFEAIKAHVVVK